MSRTPKPTRPAIKLASFVCLADSELNACCLKWNTAGFQAKIADLPMPIVLGNASMNQAKPAKGLPFTADVAKMRADLDFINNTITYSLDSRICVDGVANSNQIQLDVCRRNVLRGFWDLSPFAEHPDRPAQLVHVFSGRCLSVMQCRKIPIDKRKPNGAFYCDRNVDGLKPATRNQIAVGNVLGLADCLPPAHPSFVSQSFTPIRECAPGCPPFQVGDGVCQEACNVEKCNWDSKCVGECPSDLFDCGTPSPTVPTMSPSAHPSTTPSTSPSVSPSTSRPSKSPSVSPSRTPSFRPTQSPSKTPSTSRPSKSPSISPTQTPSISPSVSPTQTPSISPSFRIRPSASPSFSPTIRPTAAAAGFPIWAIIVICLLALLCLLCCCLAGFLIWRRRNRKQKRDAPPTEMHDAEPEPETQAEREPENPADPEAIEFTAESFPTPQPTPPPPPPRPATPRPATPVEIDVSDVVEPPNEAFVEGVPEEIQRKIYLRDDLYTQIRAFQGNGRSFFRWVRDMYDRDRPRTLYTHDHEAIQSELARRYGHLSDAEIKRRTAILRERLSDPVSNLLDLEDRYTQRTMAREFPHTDWREIDFELLDRIVAAKRIAPDTFEKLLARCAVPSS